MLLITDGIRLGGIVIVFIAFDYLIEHSCILGNNMNKCVLRGPTKQYRTLPCIGDMELYVSNEIFAFCIKVLLSEWVEVVHLYYYFVGLVIECPATVLCQ